MNKKIGAMILSVCIITGNIPMTGMYVKAQEIKSESYEQNLKQMNNDDYERVLDDEWNTATNGDFKYAELDDGTIGITKYVGNATEVTIPSEIDGKCVTTIGDDAFRGCSSLKNIVITDGITTIGECAFMSCSNLCNVSLSKDLTYIGDGAF